MSTPLSIVQSSEDPFSYDENDSSPASKRIKKLTSPVWKEFEKIKKNVKKMVDAKEVEVEVVKAVCFHCKHEFDGDSKKGTSHLGNHLKRCMKRKGSDIRQQLINATMTKSDGTCVLTNFQFDDEKSQILLVKAIIMHNYPFNIVHHKGFKDYVHSLRPGHKVPSRPTVNKLVTTIYQEEKKKLYDLFGRSSFKLSLTMDKWTASSQNLSYLCITAHYIDDEWHLQKRIIGFINVHESTGMDICNTFVSRMLDWNVDGKLFTVTVDNDKANDSALKFAKQRLGRTLACDGIFFHVRCAAHIINLIVQDGLKKIAKAIENVRNSVKYVLCSPHMESSFYEVAKQTGVNSQKCLSLDVCTRWNSTYLMLENAMNYKLAFARFQLKDDKYTCCPSDNEWKHVKTLSKCLKYFYDATELLSGTSYPTSSLFFEQFCEISLLLNEWLKSLDDVIVDMAMAMKKKFDKYWNMVNKIFAVASFIDPRFKKEAIIFYFNLIHGESDGSKYTDEIVETIRKLYGDYLSNAPSGGTASSSVVRSQVVDSASGGRKSRFAQFIQSRDVEPTKTDLNLYMQEDVLMWDENASEKFDILIWWKANSENISYLGELYEMSWAFQSQLWHLNLHLVQVVVWLILIGADYA